MYFALVTLVTCPEHVSGEGVIEIKQNKQINKSYLEGNSHLGHVMSIRDMHSATVKQKAARKIPFWYFFSIFSAKYSLFLAI